MDIARIAVTVNESVSVVIADTPARTEMAISDPPLGQVPPAVSIIVPAHNEERTVARLLGELAGPHVSHGRHEVVVVCNGCSDRTAEISRCFSPTVRTIDLPEPSKYTAMRAGDAAATAPVRVYVDADVVISAAAIELLVRPILEGTVLAAAPARRIQFDRHASRLVRWYYDVWECLPQVRHGLFGRGVIALSESGAARVRELPPAMSDDLAISESFTGDERIVVDEALVTVRAPRTFGDLVQRRTRVATGNAQADKTLLRTRGSRTSLRMLGSVVLANRSLLLKVPVFLGVGALAKLRSREAVKRGDFATWLRDESSRSAQ